MKRIIGLFAIILLVIPSIRASKDPSDSQEAWDTFLDLGIIDQVLRIYLAQHPESELPDSWITMDEFRRDLPQLYRDRLPTKDGWGEKLRVGTVSGRLVVISTGENGESEAAELLERRSSGEVVEPDEVDMDDIVLHVGRAIGNRPRTVADRQARTLVSLRSIKYTLRAHWRNNERYPVQNAGLQELSLVEQELEASGMRVPLEDGWGNPILYWSDGYSYMVVAPGSDEALDQFYVDSWRPKEVELSGVTNDPEADVVLVDGEFLQHPRLD